MIVERALFAEELLLASVVFLRTGSGMRIRLSMVDVRGGHIRDLLNLAQHPAPLGLRKTKVH